MTDELDLDAIEARASAATLGPWSADGSEIYVFQSREWIGETLRLDDPRASADAELCAHARSDVPKLVAEVRRLRFLVATLNEYVQEKAAEADKLRAELADAVETHGRGGP